MKRRGRHPHISQEILALEWLRCQTAGGSGSSGQLSTEHGRRQRRMRDNWNISEDATKKPDKKFRLCGRTWTICRHEAIDKYTTNIAEVEGHKPCVVQFVIIRNVRKGGHRKLLKLQIVDHLSDNNISQRTSHLWTLLDDYIALHSALEIVGGYATSMYVVPGWDFKVWSCWGRLAPWM